MTNRGRFQAQGNGVEKSATWATNNDFYKDEGIERVDDLQAQLTAIEYNERNIALQKARNFVNFAPAEGHFGQLKKSFHNNIQQRRIRVDLEINAGAAFLTRPLP